MGPVDSPRNRRRAPAALALAGLLLAGPARGWNPPGPREVHASSDLEPGARHHVKAHAYIVEHAIDILERDGRPNWAAVARWNRQALIDGVNWADQREGVIEVRYVMYLFWGLSKKVLGTTEIVKAGMGHYFNPDTGRGFSMTEDEWWQTMMQVGGTFLTTTLSLGLVTFDVEYRPRFSYGPHPSALENLQRDYDEARAALAGHATRAPGGYASASDFQLAMFHLGEALHYVGDCGQISHTYDSYMANHQEYENFADGKGDDPSWHATDGGVYHPEWKASEFARRVTAHVHVDHLMDGIRTGDGPMRMPDADFAANLHHSLPTVERHTAGLIAKFLGEAGIDPERAPLRVSVAGPNGGIPGAFLFYRRADQPRGAWDVLRTDADGKALVPAIAGHSYLLRPAMPGYLFEGYAPMGEQFNRVSPIRYTPSGSQIGGLDAMDVFLRRLPDPMMQQQTPTIGQPPRVPLDRVPVRWIRGTGASERAVPGFVSDQLARSLQRAVLRASADDYVLGPPGNRLGLPSETEISIHLAYLLDVRTGLAIRSPSAAQAVVTAAATEPRRVAAPAWDTLRRALPSVAAQGGEPLVVYSLSDHDGSFAHGSSILAANGIVPLPSPAGAVLSVEASGGSGMLAGAAPVRLTSDAAGTARLRVRAAGTAGHLRLVVRVVSNPAAPEVLPETALELVLQPGLTGTDPDPPRPPVLEPVVPRLRVVSMQALETGSWEHARVELSDGRVTAVTRLGPLPATAVDRLQALTLPSSGAAGPGPAAPAPSTAPPAAAPGGLQPIDGTDAIASAGIPACEEYTLTALAQARQSRERGCGFAGPRWDSDDAAHRAWCGGQPTAVLESETRARTGDLERCLAGRETAVGADARCTLYAATATHQASLNRTWACGGTGPRWSDDYLLHYRWCTAQRGDEPDREARAREQLLAQCGNW